VDDDGCVGVDPDYAILHAVAHPFRRYQPRDAWSRDEATAIDGGTIASGSLPLLEIPQVDKAGSCLEFVHLALDFRHGDCKLVGDFEVQSQLNLPLHCLVVDG
jgi:hypothetical protein